MSRRHVIILVLLAVILTGFSVALSRRDSHDWRSIRSRRLFPFPWQDAVGVTVTRPGGEPVHFRREPGAEWRVELAEEMWDSLDSRASDNFAALATLTRRDPMPDRAPPDPASAVTLVASSQAGQEIRLEFGDVRNNIRSVVVDGDKSVVYGVNQDLLAFLDWPRERLQNIYLASVGSGRAPERISLSPAPMDKSLAITLVRRPGEWGLTEPVEWPADEARTGVLLRWLDRLSADSVAAEKPEHPDRYGLKTPSARVEAQYRTPAGMVSRRIDFGGDAGVDGVYAAVESRGPVFVVSRDLLAEIFPNAIRSQPGLWRSFYRKRSLNLVKDEEPVAYRVERLLPEPAVLTVTGNGGDGEWTAELQDGRGVRHFPVDPPNPARPDYGHAKTPLGMLKEGLADIRIQSFLADLPPGREAEQRTAFPAWRLSCRFADGDASPVLTVYAADETGTLPCGDPYADGDAAPRDTDASAKNSARDGFVFSLSNRQAIMESYALAAARLCLPPYRYRSRRLLRLDAGTFTKAEVSVRAGTGAGRAAGDAGDDGDDGDDGDAGTTASETTVYYRLAGDFNNQWWRNPAAPEPLMDDNNRFAAVMDSLSRLEVEGYVADADADMLEFGLDQPEITAIVYTSIDEPAIDESAGRVERFTLTVGGRAAHGKSRYARLDGEGPVFLLPEEIAAALIAEYR